MKRKIRLMGLKTLIIHTYIIFTFIKQPQLKKITNNVIYEQISRQIKELINPLLIIIFRITDKIFKL